MTGLVFLVVTINSIKDAKGVGRDDKNFIIARLQGFGKDAAGTVRPVVRYKGSFKFCMIQSPLVLSTNTDIKKITKLNTSLLSRDNLVKLRFIPKVGQEYNSAINEVVDTTSESDINIDTLSEFILDNFMIFYDGKPRERYANDYYNEIPEYDTLGDSIAASIQAKLSANRGRGLVLYNKRAPVYNKRPISTKPFRRDITGGALDGDLSSFFAPASFQIVSNASGTIKGIQCNLYKIMF